MVRGIRQASYSYLAQVAPGVQSIVILKPALANIVAVIHIWDHDVSDAGVGLSLRLSHGLTEAAHDQNDARSPSHVPLAAHLLDVFDVHFLWNSLLEQNRRILGDRQKGRIIIERKMGKRRCGRRSGIHFSLLAL